MKTWDAWWGDIMPHVGGCTLPMLQQELRAAAREFFAFTKAWQVWTDPVLTIDGKSNYDIEIPTDAEIISIDKAEADGRAIRLLNWRALPVPIGDYNDHGGVSSADRLTFDVSGIPQPGKSIRLQITCMPTLTASGLPDDVATQHWDALRAGALSRLLAIPGDFHDQSRAGYYLAVFSADKAAAQYRAYRNNSTTMPRARLKSC